MHVRRVITKIAISVDISLACIMLLSSRTWLGREGMNRAPLEVTSRVLFVLTLRYQLGEKYSVDKC